VMSARADGTPVPVELSVSLWSLGGAEYRTAIVRDVTERRRVQESQARLAAVLDTTPDLVAIGDPRGRIEYVNRAARVAFGGEASSPRRIVDLLPPDRREGFWSEVLPAALRDGVWLGESELCDPAGGRIPV
jgi:PAS domain-containing protein